MKRTGTAVLAAVLLLAACGGKEEPAATETVDAGAQLHALFDEHFERNLELNRYRCGRDQLRKTQSRIESDEGYLHW